jgi:hypothetical protein
VSCKIKGECQQKATLLKAVADAMAAFYTARAKHASAMMQNRNLAAHVDTMDAARRVERTAIAELDEHQKEHQC